MPLQSQEFVARSRMRLLSELREDSKQSMAMEVLRQTGFLRIRVLGESMLPGIWPGDLIIIKRQPAETFAIGDIGLFNRSDRFFAHRIEKIVTILGSLHFITRGDSVSDNDPSFHQAELLGKVVAIQRNGQTRVPAWPQPLYALIAGWILCHCNRLRSLSLRVHALYGLRTHREFGGKNAQHGNFAGLSSPAK
jgi:signal peptidase I